MSTIRCLIVDDEPIARDIVRSYCSYIPLLQIVDNCGNAFEAKKILQEKEVDLLFLDINMPVLDGMGFLKTLKNKPQVIFTTAYKEHAATAFDLAACDYLVKPFSLERFIVAVDKAIEKISPPVKQPVGKNENDLFFLKADGKIYSLHFDAILYAEAKGNYTKVTTDQNIMLPAISFTAFEEILPPELFVRVHRSFIVNLSKITHIEGNTIYINNLAISIGNKYKEKFLKRLRL